MAEFVANAVQLVEPNQNVLLNDSIPCPHGYVIHRNGSGIITLRGIVNNPCGTFARYQVTFNANIGIPVDGTAPAAIGVALSIDGEPLLTSRAIVTPAAATEAPPSAENYFNVTSTAIITVPKGCCYTIAVENVSPAPDATTPAPAINVQNANLTVARNA